MKRFFILYLLFFSINSYSQEMGQIEINRDFTAALNFSDDIEFIVLGNNPQIGETAGIPKYKFYDIFQSGRTCVIRGNDPEAPETSITVKLQNGSIWYGTVKFGNNTRIFYDFTKSELDKEKEKQNLETLTELKKEAFISERLNSLMSEKTEYSTFGISENKLQFQVSNIKNDDKYTYIKIIADNNSGSDYEIEAVLFKYIEGKRKGLAKKEAKIEERISTVYEKDVHKISAYSTENLGYVIPLFSIGDQGNLIIQFKEKNGTRNPRIEIMGKDMLRVNVFEHTTN